jgi:hypothetical protein
MSRKTAAIRYSVKEPLTSLMMSVDAWIDIERNPHQRCERLRTDKPHLKVLKPTHRVVHAAVLPDGATYKLDGHTRAYKWLKNTLERPDHLLVVVHSMATLEEIEEAYEHFDSRNAVKTTPDAIQSALNALGIVCATPWLKAGKFGAALSEACIIAKINNKKTSTIDRVGKFKQEIKALDALNSLHHKQFPLGILAAAFVSIRQHGARVLPFWQAFNDGLGQADGRNKDAVKYLDEYLASAKAGRRLAGKQNNQDNMSFALGCVHRYVNGNKRATKAPSMIELASYFPTPRVGRPPKIASAAVVATS